MEIATGNLLNYSAVLASSLNVHAIDAACAALPAATVWEL